MSRGTRIIAGVALAGAVVMAAGVYWVHAMFGLVNAASLVLSIPLL